MHRKQRNFSVWVNSQFYWKTNIQLGMDYLRHDNAIKRLKKIRNQEERKNSVNKTLKSIVRFKRVLGIEQQIQKEFMNEYLVDTPVSFFFFAVVQC